MSEINAYATTSDNPLGADEGVSIIGPGFEIISNEPVSKEQDPDIVLDEDAADKIVLATGWKRSGPWTYSGGQYTAPVEPGDN